MKTFDFKEIRHGKGRKDAIESGVCLVEFKGSGSRQVEDKCLLVNVTGVPGYFIKDLAEACVKSVEAARPSEE